ncbi:MAG: hypothetical protein KAJ91_02105 [Candidatus Aenigmarchaeota archaeon]|nr:hypothetical protein [Candidatus Aenigmarchaeota archaeon]MCK5333395.1 hypothetical protein [Candidatus Aenigmarchaeota archaeon]
MHRVLLTLFLFFALIKNSLTCKPKTPFAKTHIRKFCVALKSQANAVTFIFLSGIVLSQSLIIAYNFMNSTTQNLSFSDGMSTPTGFSIGVPEQGEDSLAVPEELNEPAFSEPVLEEVPDGAGDNSESPEGSSAPADVSEAVDDGPANAQTEEPDSEEIQEPQTPAATSPEDETTEPATPADDEEEVSQEIPAESDENLAERPSTPQDEQENESQENPPSESPPDTNSTPESLPEPITVPVENETSELSIPALPDPVNETQDLNETIDDYDNTTVSPEPPTENNSTDADVPDVTPPVFEEAILEASLVFPLNIQRGDTFTLVVSLTNTGSAPANNIVVEPQMPSGAITTEASKTIDSLAVGESSEIEFTIQLSYETLLGENEITVRATYE